MDVCLVVFAVLDFLGVVLLVAGSATDYWRRNEIIGIKTNEGLFRRCVSAGNSETCSKMYSDIGEEKAKFAAVVVCMVLALLFHFIGWLIGIFGRLCKKDVNKMVLLLLLFTVLFAAGGLSIYTHNYGSDPWEFYWSYGLCWAGTGCIFISGIALLIVSVR